MLKKLYGQNTIYNNFFINRKELLLLIKKKNLISIEKIHSIKNIYIWKKKIQFKKKKRLISTELIYKLMPLSHTLGSGIKTAVTNEIHLWNFVEGCPRTSYVCVYGP